MVACGWSLALASLSVVPQAAIASQQSIDLPAERLDQAIDRLAARYHLSIGIDGRLPSIRVKPVRGARTAADALRQLLDGSGYRAVAVGPAAFRIEVAAAAPRPASSPVPIETRDEPEIIVTALKRRQSLSTTPATVRSVAGDSLRSASGTAGMGELAQEVPALSMSQLGPGQNRLFLRGIGDGPLGGFNQGSVAILFNESRLTFDSPDPDLALIDIDRIEVLEGPQGPLYGTGALGGIIKIMSAKPMLDEASAWVRAGLSTTEDGDLSTSQSAMVNLPIARDRLGLRAVIYRADSAGWIDNVGGRSDSNRGHLAGGRLALRWLPVPNWSVDLAAAVQARSSSDSQYVDGDLGQLERPGRSAEPRDADARLLTLTVNGMVGGLRLVSVSGVSTQEAVAFYDASPLAGLLETSGTTIVRDSRKYVLLDQEVRLSNAGGEMLDWLAGASLVKASTDARIAIRSAGSSAPLLTFRRDVTEAAVFGEATATLSPKWSLTGGARLFYNRVEDERSAGGDQATSGRGLVRASASASLGWKPRAGRYFFLRAATAYRPGGVNIGQQDTGSYEADELASVELGARAQLGATIAADGTLFATQWKHVQADELLPDGLVATRNAGNASNFGLEGRVRWTAAPGLHLETAFMVQSARLEAGSATAANIDDRRLPAVPHLAVRASAARSFSIRGWSGEARAGVRYTGATHLSFDPALDRRSAGLVTVDAGLTLSRDGWSFDLVSENLGNSAADSFAYGNPYRVRTSPQRTPLKPRSLGIQVSRHF